MTIWLLDVNVLIALIDAQHTQHQRAGAWFEADPARQWLSCPMTENGMIRIMSNAAYSAPLHIADVAASVRVLMSYGRHRFVPDDISLLDDQMFYRDRILSSRQITDTYLLALAARHGAALATFDTRMATNAVRSADAEVFLIP